MLKGFKRGNIRRLSRLALTWGGILSTIAFLGLIATQYFWISNALRLSRYQFDHRLTLCLNEVSEEINGNVSALAADGKKLYVGSDKGLYVLNGDKVKRFLISSNALSGENKINDIFIDKQKRVWIASDKWLTMMSKGVIKNIDVGNKMQMLGNIHCLTSIGESVFMGSSNDGIIKYDIRSGQLSKYISVDCNIISELSTDGRNNLYVATDGTGAQVISV